jgi:2-oxoglutarate dehydrogenase E2 component (dihydrolipoamide succinyltransferase)
MTFSVTMPALGESVTEGTVTRWLKNEGDVVAVDEPLLEVSTDKVDTEIPSPAAGVLQKIVVAVDQTVPVGAELAVIADSGSTPVPSAPATPVAATPAPAPTPPAPTPPAPTPAAPVIEKPVAPAVSQEISGSGNFVTMPALGESVTEGTVTRWLKNVGDSVNVDEPLLEVSTDKVDTEIPSPVSGVLLSIEVPVDSTVPVGARLATIGSSNGAAPAPTPVAQPVQSQPAPTQSAPTQSAPVTQPAPVCSGSSNSCYSGASPCNNKCASLKFRCICDANCS